MLQVDSHAAAIAVVLRKFLAVACLPDRLASGVKEMTPALRKFLYWLTAVTAWALGIGLLYVAAVFIFLGPMMGPRGDIDYPDFAEQQKAAAEREAIQTQFLGLVPLSMSGVVFFVSRRVARRISGVQK